MKKFLSVLSLVLLVGCADPSNLVADIDENRYNEAMALKEDLKENRQYYSDDEVAKIEEHIYVLLKNNKYY